MILPTSRLLPQPPKKDDIRTTYHPHSKRKTTVESFEEYGASVPSHPHAHHPKPWLPFHSESEFAFAEIILESSLSSTQVDCLINVIWNLIYNGELFMVKDHCELKTLWKGASDMLALVCLSSCVCLLSNLRILAVYATRDNCVIQGDKDPGVLVPVFNVLGTKYCWRSWSCKTLWMGCNAFGEI